MPSTDDDVLELPDDCTLELVWKNNERLKEYVLVRSKELEYDEDPSSVSETARAGHFTLEQCLNLFTKPEVLAPEEAWYVQPHLNSLQWTIELGRTVGLSSE